MDDATKLADFTGQLADPARAAMVLRLMDGEPRPTGDLRESANVSPSSASMHLSKLVNARILTTHKHGRTKYYRISSAAVAHAIEALTVVASPGTVFRQVARSALNPFAFARTCYDHLAGRLGVEIVIALQTRRLLVPAGKRYELTEKGAEWLESLDISPDSLRQERRQFAPQCLDYTERRPHLAGSLGAALLRRMIELNWVAKSRVPRAVRVTIEGKVQLSKLLGINV